MSNSINIMRTDIPRGKRILATSDIHGHLSHLENVLKAASFCADDLLIIVGDIVEKGPESLKTLRYVMKLCEGGNVIALAGNVDMWRLHMIEGISEASAGDFYNYLLSQREWKGTSLFDEMAAECGTLPNSPEEVLASKEEIMRHFKAEFNFIRSRPTALETQNYIFVHGGMPIPSFDADMSSLNMYSFLKYDNFMATELNFDKYIIVGHWPVSLYDKRITQMNPIINREKRIISIDGACGLRYEGQLNLIAIPDISCDVGEIEMFSYDPLPVFTALDDQDGSEDSIAITWPDNEINELEVQDDLTYVEHVSSGRRLWVCSDCIFTEHRCIDSTDYELPVRAGDKLSISKVTSRGYIAKKNGVVGWYRGKLAEEPLTR